MDNLSSSEWDDHWDNSNVISDYHLLYYNFLKSLTKKLPRDAKILEAGCGSGRGMACFTRHEVHGIDISDRAIELSRKYGRVKKGDVQKIPFNDNTFDLTYNSGVIEHLEDPSIAVREMVRVTKQNGLVVIIVPNKYCLFYQIYKKLFWHIGEKPFSFNDFKKNFKEYKNKKFFGLHSFIPFATSKTEFLPLKIRQKIVKIDNLIPFKQYHAYAIGVIIKK
ncbi:MAG: class I SAM-dependent methyltransferase [Nanoarchaeota archaeon]